MSTTITAIQLEELRSGDRLRYHGVDWNIEEYSTYQDPQGYLTDEWLLNSPGGSQYYLLREFDPNNQSISVTWYLAHPLQNARLALPNSQENIVPRLWQDMQSQAEPYPELQLFYKSYYFESQTEGNYETEGDTQSRITWDYWDQEHQMNLAIEAFSHGQLNIYSTKIVKPEEFSHIQKTIEKNHINIIGYASKIFQTLVALILLFLGLTLMIFG
ncbi:MAG: DUF4178 domain-containing protein [Mojavia pulchra JT2-VF2]|jgi:hypothetical protein|uniref:DUF4178 domain-containing protein n=1 Tax=Mojavia pulchra JT2-VF2 TaxID=287848 RepID=A0A951PZ71_9NOST|nr:DUF4178 domain-containing protein [Mojavia pulchra JT2-VF2]